ncbi:anti-sigma factor domain-containing protein [Bacillus sp. AK128]
MKRGVILEVSKQYVTVLTPDGEFLKGRKVKDNYQIGEEIDFFPLNERASTKKARVFNLGKLRIALASSVAAVILFFSAFSYYDSHQVYAYMSIDINPSIEAGVDKKLRVITLKAYNEEGRLLVESLEEWKNNSISVVTNSIIQKSKESGYYEEGKEVILATVIVDDEGKKLKKKLTDDVNSLAKHYQAENVLITVMDRNTEERQLAIDKGISTGKYVKEFLMAKEEKPESKIEKPVEEKIEKQPEVSNKPPIEEKKEELQKVKVEEKTNENPTVNKDGASNGNQEGKGQKGPPPEVKEKLKEVKEKIKNKQRNRDDDDEDEDDESEDEDEDEDDDDDDRENRGRNSEHDDD